MKENEVQKKARLRRRRTRFQIAGGIVAVCTVGLVAFCGLAMSFEGPAQAETPAVYQDVIFGDDGSAYVIIDGKQVADRKSVV